MHGQTFVDKNKKQKQKNKGEKIMRLEHENEKEYAGKGWATLNTVLGSIGTAGATGMLGNLGFGAGNGDNAPVTKYELNLQREITNKDMEIAFLRGRDAAKSDTLATYAYIDGELTKMREKIAAQDVKNAQIEGAFAVLGEQLKAQKNEFICALNRERDERCCSDNAIITYANATFYPKMVADVTVGTTTTAQTLYNPLPNCH